MKGKSMENTLNNTIEGAKKMKTPYEIAWDLLMQKEITMLNATTFNLACVFGLSTEEMDALSHKAMVFKAVKEYERIKQEVPNILKKVIEEMEQGKPHWEIERANVDVIDTSV